MASLGFEPRAAEWKAWTIPLILCVITEHWHQCDHMDILLIQYLAIYNNDNWHNSIMIGPSRFKYCQILN